MKLFTNTKLFNSTTLAKPVLIIACFLILAINKESNALLLGNLIGCSSFSCRLSAVEADVSHLKMQMVRLTGDTSMLQNSNGMNNFRPFGGQGQGMNSNQGMNQNQQGQMLPNNQQITQATNNPANRVNLGNLNLLPEYQSNQQQQQLRRADNQYQNLLANQIP